MSKAIDTYKSCFQNIPFHVGGQDPDVYEEYLVFLRVQCDMPLVSVVTGGFHYTVAVECCRKTMGRLAHDFRYATVVIGISGGIIRRVYDDRDSFVL